MKTSRTSPRRAFSPSRLAAWLALAATTALAAPGAHGPGGEHLDAPAGASGASIGTQPRMEAASDLFELVAVLGGGELSILLDRFATNEPVLQARVQVEVGSIKADAAFHADHGDYAVADATMLKKLAEPGEHAIVVAVFAGAESDLLNGTLVVAGPSPNVANGHAAGDGHGPALPRAGWLAGGAVLLGATALLFRRRRHRRVAASMQEGA
jgi:hypothetical protein